MEVLPLESKKKWLILSIDKPPKQNSQDFVDKLCKLIDRYSKVGNVLILGDFNYEPDEQDLLPLKKIVATGTKTSRYSFMQKRNPTYK